MQFQRKPLKPPTERELELAADWSRTSRLIEESILSRLDFDPKDIKNPKDRYAPMKWLLNDENVRYMQVQGDPGTARELRVQRRAKYSQLLRQLQADLNASYSERVSDIERSGCWRDYGSVAGESIRAQACVVLLKTALVLHLLHLPGPKALAVTACDLVRYSLLVGLPRPRVVPIR
jgi:hypothetical protein